MPTSTSLSVNKGFAGVYILIGIVVLAVLGGGLYFLAGKSLQNPFKASPKACTEEAKQCPDGSFVGREGPNCEFKPCPASTPTPSSDETVYTEASRSANWKTYTNENMGFELKYPLTFVENNKSKFFESVNGINLLNLSNGGDEALKANYLTINIYPEISLYRLKDQSGGFIFYFDTKNKAWYHDKTNEISDFVPKRVNSIVESYIYRTGDIKCTSEYILILNSSYTNIVEIINGQCRNDDGNYLPGYYNLTSDQILSTFKFLDQEDSIEGKFCGGIAANLPVNQCPAGYKCQLDGDYPDAGGKCVKE